MSGVSTGSGSMSHRDPTFMEVARRESRSCHGCVSRTVLWGLAYCKRKKWSGLKNEKRCEQWMVEPRVRGD